MKPKIISLHTRARGLDLDLEATAYEPLVCVEMDGETLATLRANRPRWDEIFAMFPPRGSKS